MKYIITEGQYQEFRKLVVNRLIRRVGQRIDEIVDDIINHTLEWITRYEREETLRELGQEGFIEKVIEGVWEYIYESYFEEEVVFSDEEQDICKDYLYNRYRETIGQAYRLSTEGSPLSESTLPIQIKRRIDYHNDFDNIKQFVKDEMFYNNRDYESPERFLGFVLNNWVYDFIGKHKKDLPEFSSEKSIKLLYNTLYTYFEDKFGEQIKTMYREYEYNINESQEPEGNKKEKFFQELIDNTLNYIVKGCDKSYDEIPNDISFNACEYPEFIENIKILDIIRNKNGGYRINLRVKYNFMRDIDFDGLLYNIEVIMSKKTAIPFQLFDEENINSNTNPEW